MLSSAKQERGRGQGWQRKPATPTVSPPGGPGREQWVTVGTESPLGTHLFPGSQMMQPSPCLEKWVLGTGTGNEELGRWGWGEPVLLGPRTGALLTVDPYEMWQGRFLSKPLWFA